MCCSFDYVRNCNTVFLQKSVNMHHVTQKGGGYAWIHSGMRSVDKQILIQTALHSLVSRMAWLAIGLI